MIVGEVSLSAETIEQIAAQVVVRLGTQSPSVTTPDQNTHRTQTDPVSSDNSQGWDTPRLPEEPRQPESNAPRCKHGEMKYVAGGFSKRTGKPYDPFYGCQGPRDDQCPGQKA